MKNRSKSYRRSGQAVVLFMLGIIIFCAFCALVVDFGRQYITNQKLRNYCDQAAMSGANLLPDGGSCAPQLEAMRIYARNILINGETPASGNQPDQIPTSCGGTDSSFTDPTTTTDATSGTVMKTYHFVFGKDSIAVTTPYIDDNIRSKVTDPTEVIRVDACRTVKNHFGLLLGWKQVRICTFGVAKHSEGAAGGVVILNPTKRNSLTATGSGTLTVDGTIHVDSNHSTSAFNVNSNATITATGNINVVGGANVNGTVSPAPSTGEAVIADPYASLPPPDITGMSIYSRVSLAGGETLTISPGVYLGGISVTNGTLIMEPGIYVMAGGGFSITSDGGASVFGAPNIASPGGVMIYNTGSDGTPLSPVIQAVVDGMTRAASVKLTGQSLLSISAPTSGTYANMLIFQDRAIDKQGSITGNGSLTTIVGSIYMKIADLTLSGQGTSATEFDSNIVVDTLGIVGGGDLIVKPPDKFTSGGIGSALIE